MRMQSEIQIIRDGRNGTKCLSDVVMRILFALLAMLSGLSLSGVAYAVPQTEVADAGSSVAMSAGIDQRQQHCIGRGGAVPQRRTTARRKTVWLPAPALIRPCIELSDRTRE